MNSSLKCFFIFLTALSQVAFAAPASPTQKNSDACAKTAEQESDTVLIELQASLAKINQSKEAVFNTKARLTELVKADQSLQNTLLRLFSTCSVSWESPLLSRFRANGKEITRLNTLQLKGVLNESGWPKISVYGADADKAAFLITQHADSDPNFQKEVLGLIELLVASRETDGENYALLFDRVQLAQKQTQKYGSQGACNGKRWVSSPIVSILPVDLERATLGMEPPKNYNLRAAKLYCNSVKG